jgi:hypothetical protein
MKKSFLDLLWPAAGIDRAMSYQRQPPYTTPDALNVRTESTSESRERGGSRPGLGLALRTTLPGPVRMMTKVSVLKNSWPRTVKPVFGSQLRDSLQSVPYAPSPTYVPGYLGSQSGGVLTGTSFGSTYPVTIATGAGPYELSVQIRPKLGKRLNGNVKMHFGLSASSDNPTINGNTATLVFGPSGYYSTITQYAASVVTGPVNSVTYTDNPYAAGTFSVFIDPATKTVQIYWLGRLVQTLIVANLYGLYFAFQVASPDQSIEVRSFAHDFFNNTDLPTTAANPRRDLIVASAEGELWVEDTVNTLKKVVTTTTLSDNVQLTAVDREQKLYIADFGIALSGENGTINNPNYNVLNHSGGAGDIDENYALEILDSNYSQNAKQTITFNDAVGGTFKVKFKTAQSPNLAYPTSAAALQTALRALSTIGSPNVNVTGTNPYTVEFVGTLAGKSQPDITVDGALLTGTAPSVQVDPIQVGAGGEWIAGTYTIAAVGGSFIGFLPALPVAVGYAANVLNVKYRIARLPKVFDPKEGTLTAHTANVGQVPAGCRLVALYRDRIVYAGSDLLPHVWYMSRQGDVNDWDYSQEDSAAAVFAQNSTAGQLADPITALIPHGDECLIFGSYNSLWIMRGDPGYGGTLDALSRKIGIVGPNAWTRTPDDMCVFLSADGLYVMAAGCAGFPTSLSRERLPDELLCLDSEREVVALEYDTLARGVHIFVTRLDGSEGSHWWFDWEHKAFWRVGIHSDHEPFSLYERTYWDDCPTIILGGRDGKFRAFDRDNQVDDGNREIESYCLLGPFHLDREGFTEGMVSELQGSIGKDSGPIEWSVLAGSSAEEAYYSDPRTTGEWSRSGLNYNARPRCRGVSALVKIAAKPGALQRWFLERVTTVIRSAGRRRIR